jgi:hypothetical protein
MCHIMIVSTNQRTDSVRWNAKGRWHAQERVDRVDDHGETMQDKSLVRLYLALACGALGVGGAGKSPVLLRARRSKRKEAFE